MSVYRAFALATIERAVKTFAQSLAALLVADGTDLLATDWIGRLSVSGMAALVSILTSVASSTIGSSGPSLAGEVTDATAQRDPASPTGESSGPASDLPEQTPVVTEPVGPAIPGTTLDIPESSDTKADAAHHGATAWKGGRE